MCQFFPHLPIRLMVVHLVLLLCAMSPGGCRDVAATTMVSSPGSDGPGVAAQTTYRLTDYASEATERQGVAVAPSATGAPMPAPTRARYVIIISEDGLRPDALLLAHGEVHAAIMREGAYSMTARTIRHASTLPSHAAMLSGFDEAAHKLSWNGWKPERGFIQVPTVFDAALHAGDGSAAFVGKRKLEHIAPPGSIDVFSRPGFFCKKVVEEAARYFVEKRPRIEFVHFSDPDERGHAVGWMSDSQIEAIRHTDACLATLIRAVHLAGLADDTLFILSADHGGHGRNHSGRTEEDRLIPWIAWGAGVRPGVHLQSAISTMDTAATALWALGYPAPPEMQGRPVVEAFAGTPRATN